MKTKLLKKVRKRFEINYYPNGYDFGGCHETESECVAIIDTSFYNFKPSPIINYWYIEMSVTKEMAYENCYDSLLRHILGKYAKYGTRRNKKLEKTEEKLWYSKTTS